MRRALPRRRCAALALHAVLAALACCVWRADCGYTPPVIAVVFPTYPARYELVAAGRDTWRKGVLTVAVTEGATEGPLAEPPDGATPSERWFTYPDDARPEAHRRSDTRAIAALRIANASLGGAYECVLRAC
jgi:hypothetical protein